jgi:hypothetical protein
MPSVSVPLNTYYGIYPEAPADVFEPEHDWKEDIELNSPGDMHFTQDGGSSATLQGEVPYNKLRSFLLYALGYAAADNTSPFYMRRINPPTHPVFPFLRSRRVTVRGFSPRRDRTTATASPPPPPATYPHPGNQDDRAVTTFENGELTFNHPTPTLPPRVASLRPRNAMQNFGGGTAMTPDRRFIPWSYWTGRYVTAKVTVEFGQPNYPLIEDDDPDFDPTDESGRNVFWTTEPTLDVIALEGGVGNALFWREQYSANSIPVIATNIPGATSTTNVTPPTSGFKAPTGFLDPKLMDVANWSHVPTRFIFDANLIPTKILDCLGKTNLTDWFGYARGTALLIGAAFTPVVWPIYSYDHHVVQLWNVKYMIKYADPPRRPDADVNPAPGGSPARGHRLFRYQDGFGYLATRFNDKGLYDETEFRNLFKHREA